MFGKVWTTKAGEALEKKMNKIDQACETLETLKAQYQRLRKEYNALNSLAKTPSEDLTREGLALKLQELNGRSNTLRSATLGVPVPSQNGLRSEVVENEKTDVLGLDGQCAEVAGQITKRLEKWPQTQKPQEDAGSLDQGTGKGTQGKPPAR